MKKTVKRLYIGIFIVALCLPQAFWFFFGGLADTTNYENRNMTERPVLMLDTYRSYPEAYEAYYNDHIPFRNDLTKLQAILDYYLFKQSPNQNVIVGKDNWLFYANESDGSPIASYQGTNLFTEEQLEQIALNCTKTRDRLAERGIEFVIFIAPNKERVYSEMMPSYLGGPSETYAALQVVEYLRENTDLRVVYAYEELMRMKELLPDRLLYFKTDTHWNDLGAYIGSWALLKELGIEMPSVTDASVAIEETEATAGDLAAMMNLKELLSSVERKYTIHGYEAHDVEDPEGDFGDRLIYRAHGADPRKLYVYGDSFCQAMSGFLGSQFSESCMLHRSNYSVSDLTEYDPDVFVLETVERYVDLLQWLDIGV